MGGLQLQGWNELTAWPAAPRSAAAPARLSAAVAGRTSAYIIISYPHQQPHAPRTSNPILQIHHFASARLLSPHAHFCVFFISLYTQLEFDSFINLGIDIPHQPLKLYLPGNVLFSFEKNETKRNETKRKDGRTDARAQLGAGTAADVDVVGGGEARDARRGGLAGGAADEAQPRGAVAGDGGGQQLVGQWGN